MNHLADRESSLFCHHFQYIYVDCCRTIQNRNVNVLGQIRFYPLKCNFATVADFTHFEAGKLNPSTCYEDGVCFYADYKWLTK